MILRLLRAVVPHAALILGALITLVAMRARAEPPFWGTIFIDPDIITASDPTAFTHMTSGGQGMRVVYDRRVTNWVTINAYLFNGFFNDGLRTEVQVNPEFGSATAASVEANKYLVAVGRLPTALRKDVAALWIHQGVEPFGGGNNSILIHTGQGEQYIADGILEETLVHEGSHTSVDAAHASAAGWIAAQNADPEFISVYARDNPTREDIAETLLTWLAVRYRPDRITTDMANTIMSSVPNRIAYFDRQYFDMHPIIPLSPLEVTVPGCLITASSGNSPPTQTASNAIDNNATSKYLNFDKINTGLTVTRSGKRAVRALTLISAEDFPVRDPSSFVIEGSSNGINFVRIASNAVPAFPARHFIQSFPLPGTNDFNVYRVLFPTVSNQVAANSMQIAEVELLQYVELTSPSDTVNITLPGNAVDVRGVGALFDRQLGDVRKLEVAPIAGGSTIVHLIPATGRTVLKGFELIGAADDMTYPERRPTSVTVAGSHDGINYTNLATVTPAAPTSNLQIQEFSATSNNIAWTQYRITFGPPVSGDRLQIGEMRLFGETVPAMGIARSAANVVLSWPDSPGFILERRTALPGVTWAVVGNATVLSNGIRTVTLPRSSASEFFRLRK